MWGNPLDQDALRRTDSSMQTARWHRDEAPPTAGPSAAEKHEEDAGHQNPSAPGAWGERDVGGFDEQGARAEFEALRSELSYLSKSRTQDTHASKASHTRSRGNRQVSQAQTNEESEDAITVETEAAPGKDEGDFELSDFMREGHFEKRTEHGSAKKVGVLYKHLTVKGVGSTASFVRTVPDAVIGTFGPDLYHVITRFFPSLKFGKSSTRTLIHDFTGCVRDGEMMLVLGRPGAGCSTFLKAVSNNRESYAAVEGEVSYGGISAEKQRKMYRGEVNYNGEDDIHFAPLSVWQTLNFALKNKTKKSARDEVAIIATALMKMFGISHTKHTQVGDEYTRGVSGGERKRVSIAETLASKSTVMTWDNSTRGLDASTALDYARSLRIMTDVSNRTT